jgi:hypothetical protein
MIVTISAVGAVAAIISAVCWIRADSIAIGGMDLRPK